MPSPEWLDLVERLAKISALLFGGVWAYVKFFKGRTFHPRVESSLTATIQRHHGSACLVIATAVKNIGFTTFSFAAEGVCLRLLGSKLGNGGKPQRAVWRELAVFPVFAHHAWIDSGETADDTVLIEVPSGEETVYKVELRFLSRRRLWRRESKFPWLGRHRVSWSRSTIAVAGPS